MVKKICPICNAGFTKTFKDSSLTSIWSVVNKCLNLRHFNTKAYYHTSPPDHLSERTKKMDNRSNTTFYSHVFFVLSSKPFCSTFMLILNCPRGQAKKNSNQTVQTASHQREIIRTANAITGARQSTLSGTAQTSLFYRLLINLCFFKHIHQYVQRGNPSRVLVCILIFFRGISLSLYDKRLPCWQFFTHLQGVWKNSVILKDIQEQWARYLRAQYRNRFFSIAIFFNTRFTKYVFSYMYAISATKCTNEEILIISIYFSIHVHRAQLFSRYSWSAFCHFFEARCVLWFSFSVTNIRYFCVVSDLRTERISAFLNICSFHKRWADILLRCL